MLLTGISRAEALQDESQQQEYRRLLEDISEEVKEKIPSLRQDIEKEFRKLLGS
jgi:thymidylate synthase ThyX